MALQYYSPGVYVEEVPSAIRPIAGASTSIAGFIGVMDNSFPQPLEQMSLGIGNGIKKAFDLPPSVSVDPETFSANYQVLLGGVIQNADQVVLGFAPDSRDVNGDKSRAVTFTTPPPK